MIYVISNYLYLLWLWRLTWNDAELVAVGFNASQRLHGWSFCILTSKPFL